MNGIDIVIKNQNGVVDSVWFNDDLYLYFDCPICRRKKRVKINCFKSVKAFKTIQYHPHTQLICENCQFEVTRLHGFFKNPTTKYTLGEVYNILKW